MINRALAVSILAVGLTACASSPQYGQRGYYGGGGYAYCQSCGVVERIEQYYGERNASGGGAIAGAIIGGVLGNQVGSGSGRRAATAAGAIAGGVAGHQIERQASGAPRFDLFLRMDDGRRIVVTQRNLDGIREGSRVEVRGSSARLLR